MKTKKIGIRNRLENKEAPGKTVFLKRLGKDTLSL